ncbi:hypothetical protein [Paenibacillus macerans]|uniref:hypothetical protein n=1 Tax=Paenibacillus macerans TaxID=44252 RepID=UPI003D323090
MKNNKWVIGLVALLIILGAVSILFYRNYTASGILWKNGISKNDIKLISTDNRYFHHYLYERNGELAGILTLQRRGESDFWSEYINEKGLYINKNNSPNLDVIRSISPTVIDHNPVHLPIFGGVVTLGDEKTFSIRAKEEIRQPTVISKVKEKTYFFFAPTDMTMEDQIEVIFASVSSGSIPR